MRSLLLISMSLAALASTLGLASTSSIVQAQGADALTAPRESGSAAQIPAPPAATPSAGAGQQAYPMPNQAGYRTPGGGPFIDSDLRLPRNAAIRLRALEGDLLALARSGRNRIVGGVMAMVSGGIAIGLGFLVREEDFLSNYLFVYGGGNLARGVVQIALEPDTSDPPVVFSHMPMRNDEEISLKLTYGERALEDLADQKQLARILDASISIGTGAAILPIYLLPNDYEVDVFGAFVLIGAGVTMVSGLVDLIIPSEAERRWDAYKTLDMQLKQRENLAFEKESALRVHLGGGPLPQGGGALSMWGTF